MDRSENKAEIKNAARLIKNLMKHHSDMTFALEAQKMINKHLPSMTKQNKKNINKLIGDKFKEVKDGKVSK